MAQSEESRERAKAVLGFLKDDVLAVARPEGQEGGLGVGVTVRKAVDSAKSKIAERFKDQPIVEAEVRHTLGETYLYLTEPTLAIPQLERAVELRRTRLGSDDPETLASRNDLAAAYLEAGRTDDAIKTHEATLKQLESNLGPDHTQTRASRSNLAAAYHLAGRPDDAIKMLEATLKQEESKLGPDHPDALISRNNLATVYLEVGRTDDAIKMHKTNITLCQSKLGTDHPQTLASARQTSPSCLHAIFLPVEPTTPSRCTRRLSSNGNRSSGPDHLHTLMSRGNLARAYQAAGQLDRAVPLLEQALQGFRTRLGLDHPYTIRIEQYLASAHTTAGRYAEAQTLLRGGLERARKRFGPADPNTIVAMGSLGSSLVKQGKWAEAEAILRECLAIREKAQTDAWTTFNTRSLLGSSLMGEKKFAEAEPLILAGYEGMKAREAKIPVPSKPRLTEAADRIVQLYETWGKKDKAAEWRVKLARPSEPTP